MRYVILRDDDTNALTPPECLERLYRPLLDRGSPVNLATIPDVDLAATKADGNPEGFLAYRNGHTQGTVPIGSHAKLVAYLKANPGFQIIQHGLHHEYLEFDRPSRSEVADRLDKGTKLLLEAGFRKPQTFVAPYDKFSPASYAEVAKRFRVISTGWFELRRLPPAWWPGYAWQRFRDAPHWKVGNTLLLAHPGCYLSCFRDYERDRDEMLAHILSHHLTVVVTHWWEYFREGRADDPFINFLHEIIEHLTSDSEIKIISFSDLIDGGISLN